MWSAVYVVFFVNVSRSLSHLPMSFLSIVWHFVTRTRTFVTCTNYRSNTAILLPALN